MASKEFQAILEIIASAPPTDPDGDVQAMRDAMEATTGGLPSPEGTNAEPVDIDGIPAEWISVKGAREDRALLYLHGGGYVAGSLRTHRSLAARLARDVGARVLALDYRLAPENPHPAALEDSTAAYAYLRGEGYAASSLAIAGDSAGGGLTIATLLALRDAGAGLPAAAAGLSAWLDLAGSGDSHTTRADADPMVDGSSIRAMATHYLGDRQPQSSPTASPLYADPRGLPPVLLQVGDAEILRDDSTRFAEKMSACGGTVELEVWPEMVHVWHMFGDAVPESSKALQNIAAFLNRYLQPR